MAALLQYLVVLWKHPVANETKIHYRGAEDTENIKCEKQLLRIF
jgi:hypothetical protein